MLNQNFTSLLKTNISSGLVVYLVALPLCLGIAVASGAPPLAGIISGIIGGLVVGALSNSHISVSGPAAGLTAILITGIIDLGSFELILLSGLIAGVFQVVFGFLRAGAVSRFFPSNVIEGMLGGIGIIIILKQLSPAFGWSGKMFFENMEILETPAAIFAETVRHINPGSVLITFVSLVILVLWPKLSFLKKLSFIPAALVAVVCGIALNLIFENSGSPLAQRESMLVRIPVVENIGDLGKMLVLPDFSGFSNPQVWIIGLTIAVVASIETLLCIEAADKMDVQGRTTDTNRELKAQGLGNMVSSLIGGLPMTSVVVRSSANAKAGATSKLSSVIHGLFLLLSVLLLATVLNFIPMATLAAILILVGYKLASPKLFMHFWDQGLAKFMPFIITLFGVVFIDLLSGVAVGLLAYVLIMLITDMDASKEKIKMILIKVRRINA